MMQPNILFIISDQHNAKVLGHKGHPDAKTPNLDRLAREGVRFENAITQNPICTPSRVTWLSGQYCHNHGYYGLCGPNPEGLPTVLGHFRRAGYRTGAIGKIHCPEYWVEDDCDLFLECNDTCSIGGSPEYHAHLREHGVFDDRDERNDRNLLSLHKPIKLPDDPKNPRGDGAPSFLAYEDSEEGWIVQRSIEFMQASAKESKPFFLQASLPRPHGPWICSEPFWSMYDEARITLPPNADYDMSLKAPNVLAGRRSWESGAWTKFEPRTYEAGRLRKLHGYLGSVSQVDHAVGELIDWMEAAGIADDTIVIYSSDHGDYACEHGLVEKAPGICADAITRIPMIWRWPGHIAAGHAAPEIVETVDFCTTVCSLAGLANMETSDGKDIAHLLRGESGEVREAGVTEFSWSKSIRMGQYRFVYYPREKFQEQYPNGYGELYDLETDPWEMENLYFEPQHLAKVREMKDVLMDWLVTTTRPKTILPWQLYESDQARTRWRNTVNADGKIATERVRRAKGGSYI